MKGVIQRFFCDRGFGFIDAENGWSYFCHISNIDIPEGQYPQIGQEVQFELVPRQKGVEAAAVKLV